MKMLKMQDKDGSIYNGISVCGTDMASPEEDNGAYFFSDKSCSAALLFTAGFAHVASGFFSGLASSGATLTVALYFYAKEQGEFGVAFAIAAILMILTLIINLAATLVGKYFEKRRSI